MRANIRNKGEEAIGNRQQAIVYKQMLQVAGFRLHFMASNNKKVKPQVLSPLKPET